MPGGAHPRGQPRNSCRFDAAPRMLPPDALATVTKASRPCRYLASCCPIMRKSPHRVPEADRGRTMPIRMLAAAAALLAAMIGSAAADPVELQWWHAMTAINLERVNKIAADFNASQNDYKVTPVYKGSYPETLTA